MDVRCPNCGTSFQVGDGSHACVDARAISGTGYLIPETVRNENITTEYGTNNSNSTEERETMVNQNQTFTMEQLAQAVAGYMSGEQTPAPVVRNGRAMTSKFFDKVMEDGNTYNPYLVRRWLPSQFIRLMKRYDGNVTKAIRKSYDWKYVIQWLGTECEKLAWLSRHDNVAYMERRNFLKLIDVVGIIEDYAQCVSDYLDRLERWSDADAKGNVKVKIPYYGTVNAGKRKQVISNGRIKEVLVPSSDWIYLKENIKSITDSYNWSYRDFANRLKGMTRIIKPDAPVSRKFIDVFEKAGAYYTLKNLILFEGCLFSSDDGKATNAKESAEMLYKVIGIEGYKIYAILKKTIADNHYTI